MPKSYFVERLGVRVDGYRTKTEAEAAWKAKRDEWCERATLAPWVFAYAGHTLIVAPTVHGWEYTINEPGSHGVRNATCFYAAPNQVAAIVDGLSALVQRLWTVAVVDDGAFFDELTTAARIHASEAKAKRSDFVYLTSRWREHATSAAA